MKISFKTIAKCGVLGCLTYVMWYKWVFGDNILILYASAAISVMSMLVGLLLSRASIRKVFPYGCLNDVVMCVYSLLFGLFVAASKSVLFSTIGTYLSFALVCLAFCYASQDTGFDWLLRGVVLIAVLCAVWTITMGYYRSGYGMVLSPTNNPHTLGFVMDMGLFAVAYRSKSTIKSFAWNLLLGTLFLYIIIQCGSRKCLLAAVFIVLPWIWIELKKILKNGTSNQKLGIVLLLSLVAAGAAYYFFHIYVNSISYGRFSNIEESQSNRARLAFFGLGFQYFLDSPLFGIGLGQFALHNPAGMYSHSTIPEAIASWGAIGSLLYFIPILAASWRAFLLAKTRRDKESVMIAALCAMELFMSFMQIYFYSLTHMIVWAIIFMYLKPTHSAANRSDISRCSYVKNQNICLSAKKTG